MHSVNIRMHANQQIRILGRYFNIHDLASITVEDGSIVDFTLKELHPPQKGFRYYCIEARKGPGIIHREYIKAKSVEQAINKISKKNHIANKPGNFSVKRIMKEEYHFFRGEG